MAPGMRLVVTISRAVRLRVMLTMEITAATRLFMRPTDSAKHGR